MFDTTKGLQEQVAYMHDVALSKEKIYEDLQEKYRHVYFSYEQKIKETLDLQGKVMNLEKKILELEVGRPRENGESSKGQVSIIVQWNVLPFNQQE